MKWLDAHAIPFTFFDYRREALDPRIVDDWFVRAGWDAVFNRNSTTFKEMPESVKVGLTARRAKTLLLAETNLIKRPILDTGAALLLGFKPEVWARALK
jgi:arsenate reductase